MYCRKCGKQIDDGSKFCPYCGGGVKEVLGDEWDDEWQEDTLTKTGQGKKSLKKWIIPVGVLAGIAVVSIIGVLAMNLSKSEPLDKKVVTEQKATPKKQEESESVKESEINSEISTSKGGTENTVEEVVYPREVTLDMEVQTKLEKLITVLEWAHYGNVESDARRSLVFLMFSMYESDLIRSGYSGVGKEEYKNVFSEQTLEQYLKDSIGICDMSEIQQQTGGYCEYKNGTVYVVFPDRGTGMVRGSNIQKITALNETDIVVEGFIDRTDCDIVTETINFQISLTVNDNSVWGGYTIKNISQWIITERGDSYEGGARSGYILPDIATRHYSENELSSMDAHTLYLARNELYARHGYIFNNADLKEYFGKKSWYEPTTTTVPDSAFNEYEKANLQLIQTLEE